MKNLLIAEIGSVHDGSLGNALKLIELAARCGANAVKFQTHIANAETLPDAPSPSYFKGETRHEYFCRTSFNYDQWELLKVKCKECNVVFMSSPFSMEAVDLLDKLDMQIYKIPSGEVTNLPMLEKIAKLGKPVILSSGMSNWNELDIAYEIFKDKSDLTIMQCTSIYPCPNNHVGLNLIKELRNRYKTKIGYSDHTLGLAAPIAAAALGATIIEKHFTFSRQMYGSDAQHSMEPVEFLQLSNALFDVWEMIDNPVNKNYLDDFEEMRDIFQKSIVFNQDLTKGTVLKFEHFAFKKPGSGIPASEYKNFIGKKLRVSTFENQMLNLNQII